MIDIWGAPEDGEAAETAHDLSRDLAEDEALSQSDVDDVILEARPPAPQEPEAEDAFVPTVEAVVIGPDPDAFAEIDALDTAEKLRRFT